MNTERKNGIILSGLQVTISIFVNIVYVPILLRYLGDNEYGLYQLAGSFFSYVTVLESGISSGVLKFYCKSLAENDLQLQENTLYVAQKIYRILSMIIFFLGGFFSFLFYYGYSSSLSKRELIEGTVIIIILFFNLIVTLLGAVYTAIIIGNEKFTFAKSLSLVVQIIQPFMVIFFVMKHPYAIVIVIIMTALNAITILCKAIYSKKNLKIKFVNHGNVDLFNNIISFAGTLFMGCIADQIFWKVDQLIIGKMFGTALVAIYSVGSQIYGVYRVLGTQISGLYYSKVSLSYHSENGLKKVSDLFTKIGRVTYLLLLLVLSEFILFGKDFLILWVGYNYIDAYYVAIIVMIPFTIDLAQGIGLSILQIVGKYRFRAKMYLCSALINIISTIFLTSIIGIKGAAFSTGISMFIVSGLIMNWYFSKVVGLDIKKYWTCCLPILREGGVLLFFSLTIRLFFDVKILSIHKLCIMGCLYTVVYMVIMWFRVMNDCEKKAFKSMLLFS